MKEALEGDLLRAIVKIMFIESVETKAQVGSVQCILNEGVA